MKKSLSYQAIVRAKLLKWFLVRAKRNAKFIFKKPPAMKLIGLMCIRNEDWILGASLPALLMWADEVVVLDHCSADRTKDILAAVSRQHPGRVHLLEERCDVWNETRLRQRLLEKGRRLGGTCFAVIDADEILTAHLLSYIRKKASGLKPGQALMLPWIQVWDSLTTYRDDETRHSDWHIPLVFADNASIEHKNIKAGYFLHTRIPGGVTLMPSMKIQSDGGILHFWCTPRKRCAAKHAWYKMNEAVLFPFKTNNEIEISYSFRDFSISPPLSVMPDEWYAPYAPLLNAIDLNAESWHEQECKRLWRQYGAEKFRGLSLYGIPQEMWQDAVNPAGS